MKVSLNNDNNDYVRGYRDGKKAALTLSNELCKCGKVGAISCPNDDRCGKRNTQLPQLPVEVMQSIEEAANDYVEETRGRQGRVETYIAGATVYATKLYQVEQENKTLNEHIETGKRYIEALIAKGKVSRDLLDEVFRKHETGLLPDRFIYEKIKKFLHGE